MAKGAGAWVLWLVASLAGAGLVSAQSSEELAGQAAEKAGRMREALVHYAAALRPAGEATSDAARLSQKIIAIALKLNPPPAIPQEAERRMARGHVAFKTAQTPADIESAATEFLEARNQAPWWPDAYFNLGVAREKQGAYALAIAAFQGYLLARPAADDAGAVKTKIYELEFLQEKAQKEEAARRQAQEEAARQAERERAAIASLSSGTWCEKAQAGGSGASCASGAGGMASISVSVNANQIAIAIDWHNGSISGEQGVVEGLNLRGTHTMRNPRAGFADSRPFTGSISIDGKLITINTAEFGYPKVYEYVRIR